MRGVPPNSTILTIAAAVAVAAGGVGCTQKDLYYPQDSEPVVTDVVFDWQHAGDAAVEGMSTYFFPLGSGGKIWNFEIPGMKGGPIAIEPGQYTMVAVNNDLPGIDLITGESASSVTVTARPGSDGSLRPSGMVYGSVTDHIDIQVSGKQSIIATPDSLATVYNIILKDVDRPEMITSLYARITGVAVSLNVTGRTASEDSGYINIPIDMTSEIMHGSSTGLGTPSGTPRFTLTLYAELADKRRQAKSLTFDITGQVTGARYPHNVYIILSGIKFDTDEPDEPSAGDSVGMEIDVDGWSSIIIDLITGT